MTIFNSYVSLPEGTVSCKSVEQQTFLVKETAYVLEVGEPFPDKPICMVGGVILFACNPIGDDEPNGLFVGWVKAISIEHTWTREVY